MQAGDKIDIPIGIGTKTVEVVKVNQQSLLVRLPGGKIIKKKLRCIFPGFRGRMDGSTVQLVSGGRQT